MRLQFLYVLLGITIEKVVGVYCDFHSIFQTPEDYKRDFDSFGIVERSNFGTGTPEEYENSVAVGRNEIPRAYANAQINLRFGDEPKKHHNLVHTYYQPIMNPVCVQQRFGTNGYVMPNSIDGADAKTISYVPNTLDYADAKNAANSNLLTQFLVKLLSEGGKNCADNTTDLMQNLNGTTTLLDPIKVDGFSVIPVNCTKCDDKSKLLVTYPISENATNGPNENPSGKTRHDLDVGDLSAVKSCVLVEAIPNANANTKALQTNPTTTTTTAYYQQQQYVPLSSLANLPYILLHRYLHPYANLVGQCPNYKYAQEATKNRR